MADTDGYNGWTNRETWLVALWINNDQGWQESVHEAITALTDDEGEALIVKVPWTPAEVEDAGRVIQADVESVVYGEDPPAGLKEDLLSYALARVEWSELGASFLQSASES